MPEDPEPSGGKFSPSTQPPTQNNNPPLSSEDRLLRAVAELDKEPQPFQATSSNGTLPPPSQALGLPKIESAPPKSKKKLILIITTIVVLLLGAGSGTAFALWFNSPDVVTGDALKNLVSSKTFINQGTYRVDDHANKGSVSLTFNSQANVPQYAGVVNVRADINYQNFSVTFNGAAMMSQSGSMYIKVNNAKNFINKALASDYGKLYASDPKLKSAVQALVAKIDGKWIKLDQTTFFLPSDFAVQRSCEKKALNAYYDDSSQQNQIVGAFLANRFVGAKSTGKSETINGQDSIGYNLSYNVESSIAFGKALQKTKLGKALNSCTGDETFASDQSSQDQQAAQKEADKTKTTAWISRWTHQLTRVDVSSSDSSTTTDFSATFQTNQTVQLNDPQKFVKLSDFQKDLDTINNITVNDYSSSDPLSATD